MVDFGLSDEQRSVRGLAREFAAHEIRPVAWDLDVAPAWPEKLILKAWEVGLMNSHVPLEYGGPGLGAFDGCLVAEELGWGCSGLATTLMGNGLAAAPVLFAGSEELKREYVGALTEAPLIASFCLTEPEAGSDVASMRTTAERRGDTYVLNGAKCFITNASRARWFTVFAKTSPDAGSLGISAFVVDRDSEGVHVGPPESKLGQRSSDTATVTFVDTPVPASRLLGAENKGFDIAMATLDRTRPGVAAVAVGIARAAFEFARDYARTRVQFGVPIAMHQGVQFLIADMATNVEAARLLTWRAAHLLDTGKRAKLASSHAKRFAADAAMEIALDAVQVFGGHGVMTSNKVEKLMRDAKIMQIYEGTSQIQRVVIAREVLKPGRGRTS
ncbi:acyl-CoA dehydrogenase [Modestobacter sp. I12A-02628]|uniref:Acyl-CoA dehydrogenase n=1 Tax=Goekera deserti TaxID=2497753 RepID=A0A7K3WEJ5_9ACTN|nr:acyl-CoA dehydrogenase family protein [Goekera deserti]MPQ96926.1 acyl-CoA dehydrogenase [Goekera deserti]NDI46760.1 acyl-CoA dehydrogenase [Goekera deserti]NEL54329.1 acyl-CoA dehydrogenase [Goekera deserti]